MTASPTTRKGFRGRRSIHGDTASGRREEGRNCMAMSSAEARVLPVSSKTRNDSAKLLAMPPTAPRPVAHVISVKFRVQSVSRIYVTSASVYRFTLSKKSRLFWENSAQNNRIIPLLFAF